MLRIDLAQQFGWTLPEVDSLSMLDLEEYFQVEDGKAKAQVKNG
jgi:hypothetical protein